MDCASLKGAISVAGVLTRHEFSKINASCLDSLKKAEKKAKQNPKPTRKTNMGRGHACAGLRKGLTYLTPLLFFLADRKKKLSAREMFIGCKMMWHGRCGMADVAWRLAFGERQHAPKHDDRQSCLPNNMTK